MNKLEKQVYDILKGSPAIKNFVRNIYQGLYDLLPTPANRSLASIECREGYFFGFHDRSPFSSDMKKLLANHSELPVRMPQECEALEVGYFDFEQGRMGAFHRLDLCFAWNWHKGCRLQWVDARTVAFNTEVDGVLKTCVYSVESGSKQYLPHPIDTVSEDGQWASSFSYERLNVLMPGYGYPFCKDNGYLGENAPAETGMYLMNMATGQRRLLVSLKQLAEGVGDPEALLQKHYVTHSEFSKDGRYLSFMHRYIGNDYRKRTSRMIIYDLQTDSYSVLPTTGMVSHYCWNSRNQLIAYCSVKEGDAHVMFDIPQNTYKPVMLGALNVDGHQSLVNDDCFVTDTYPDKRRMATLYAVDVVKQQKCELAYLHSPKKYQTQDEHFHIACDLHPRMSPDARFVCFDSVHTGKRALCVMPFSKE